MLSKDVMPSLQLKQKGYGQQATYKLANRSLTAETITMSLTHPHLPRKTSKYLNYLTSPFVCQTIINLLRFLVLHRLK